MGGTQNNIIYDKKYNFLFEIIFCCIVVELFKLSSCIFAYYTTCILYLFFWLSVVNLTILNNSLHCTDTLTFCTCKHSHQKDYIFFTENLNIICFFQKSQRYQMVGPGPIIVKFTSIQKLIIY